MSLTNLFQRGDRVILKDGRSGVVIRNCGNFRKWIVRLTDRAVEYVHFEDMELEG